MKMGKLTEVIQEIASNSATTLNLHGKWLGDAEAKYIARALKRNQSITTLILDCNGIGCDGASYLKDALKLNSCIASISLNQNRIGRTGAHLLASALTLNESISTLSLDSNEICNDGVAYIARALKVNQTLTFLSLDCNGIGDDGATSLAEALAINKAITTLSLDCNEIGDFGAKGLAAALIVNQAITSLSLQCNEIGDNGARFLAEALKINACISYIYLNQNIIGSAGAKCIAEALKVNKSIITLNLKSNGIGDVGASDLAEDLQISRENTKNSRQGSTANQTVKHEEQIHQEVTQKDDSEERVDVFVPNILLVKDLDGMGGNHQFERDDETTIKKISDLIKDGNDRLRDYCKKGILLLGNTGAGKSTLAHLLSGKKLQAIMNEDTGQLVIDALEPHIDIIIGHAASETRIPNKCVYKDITIWDCPGYYDTDHIQEIANTFYIKRLFETTDELKFVLVVPEVVLSSAYTRGSNFIALLSNAMKSFNDVEAVMGCISLVVTHVAPTQSLRHINNLIDKIMTNHPNATDEHRLINKLKNDGSIHLFYKPTGEGELTVPNLLTPIESNSKYCAVEGGMVNIAISKKAMDCSFHLLRKAINNFNELLAVIFKAICNTTQDAFVNAFCENYARVKDWLPSSIQYNNLLQNHDTDNKYFLELDLLLHLQKILGSCSVDSLTDVVITFQKAVETLACYAGLKDKDIQYKIQGYAYCLQQQYEYVKFFADVCKAELIDLSEITDVLKKCHAKVTQNLEHKVTYLPIDENQSDLDYYRKVIDYLENFPDSAICKLQKAVAFSCMAFIAEERDDHESIITYFTKVLTTNSHLPKIYETLGRYFYKRKEYAKAIDCYKVINDEFNIHLCFKTWHKESKNSHDIMLMQAQCFESIGSFELAKKYYHRAFSLSQDGDFKAAALKNVGKIMANTVAHGENFVTRANKRQFYNFSLVNEEFVRKLLDVTCSTEDCFCNEK